MKCSKRKLFFLVSVFLISTIPAVEVFASPDISSVYQGPSKSYVLFEDGIVYSLDNSSEEVKKKEVLSSVKQIAVGEVNSAVLESDGSVYSWNREDGSLEEVKGLSDVKLVSAGCGHVLALKEDGTVWAWGENFEGQLGNNSTENSDIPVQANNLSNIKYIAAGFNHSIAVDREGNVYTWGSNYFGPLGDGNYGGEVFQFDEGIDRKLPYRVPGINNVEKVAGGWQHTLVLKNDGTVWGWGHNMSCQLGNGQMDVASGIVKAKDLSGITDIYACGVLSLALKNDSTLYRMGEDFEVIETDENNVRLDPYVVMTGVKHVSIYRDDYTVIKNDLSIWQNTMVDQYKSFLKEKKFKADRIRVDETAALNNPDVKKSENVLAVKETEAAAEKTPVQNIDNNAVTTGKSSKKSVWSSITESVAKGIGSFFKTISGFFN